MKIYRNLTVKAPIVVRVDGDNFHKLTSKCNFRKPFDEKFHKLVTETAREIMEEIGYAITLTYTFSDELNYLFLKDSHLPYNGRTEKASLLNGFIHILHFSKEINGGNRI